jgi:hypothetical protein
MTAWWPAAQIRCPWCSRVGAVAFVDEGRNEMCLQRSARDIEAFRVGALGRGDRVLPMPRNAETRRQRDWSFAAVRWCGDPELHADWLLYDQDVDKILRSPRMVNVHGRTPTRPTRRDL